MVETLLQRIQGWTLGRIFKWFTGIGGTLVLIYSVSVPVIKPVMADAFKEMLIEQGMDPQAFAQIQQQVAEISKQAKSLDQDLDLTRGDINGLKQQTQHITAQQDSMATQNTRIEKQLDRVVDALIDRVPQ